MYPCMHVCIYICMYVCICTYMCVYVYIYIYIYIFVQHFSESTRQTKNHLQKKMLPNVCCLRTPRNCFFSGSIPSLQHQNQSFYCLYSSSRTIQLLPALCERQEDACDIQNFCGRVILLGNVLFPGKLVCSVPCRSCARRL